MKTAREILQDWKGYLHKSEHVDVMSFLKLEMTIDQLITEAVLAEREACALIADERVKYYLLQYNDYLDTRAADKYVEALGILKEIRARTPAKGDGK